LELNLYSGEFSVLMLSKWVLAYWNCQKLTCE